jgi:hypothetical protein
VGLKSKFIFGGTMRILKRGLFSKKKPIQVSKKDYEIYCRQQWKRLMAQAAKFERGVVVIIGSRFSDEEGLSKGITASMGLSQRELSAYGGIAVSQLGVLLTGEVKNSRKKQINKSFSLESEGSSQRTSTPNTGSELKKVKVSAKPRRAYRKRSVSEDVAPAVRANAKVLAEARSDSETESGGIFEKEEK